MASLIGFYSLVFSSSLSFLIIFFSIKNFRNSKILDKKIILLSFLQFFLVFISFLGLVTSFINSDFSNETVFNHSHTTKPLFYKISGTWGNHEGSLLLWLLVLTLFIFLFIIKSRKQLIQYRILTLLFQQIIIIGFFVFLLKTSSPFNYIFPVPKEGLGLNPILQDPALAIHPPILYLGYVGTSIIFSASLSAMSLNYISKEWASHIKQWVLISWIFLTLGILLGSIWAYYELGWGGFWFWDPVENVSLMPWLALTTLIHCILVLEKRSILTSWVVILSISTFSLSMSGTFLVRSGILNSVHTFANDPERGLFILIFLFSLIFLSLFIFFFFQKESYKINNSVFLISKETSIIINNWFMMYFLSVVLIGTIYPIILDVIASEKISVGPPFYNKLIVPFLIPFLFIMTIGPKLKWIKSDIKDKIYLFLFFLVSILLSMLIIKNLEINFLYYTILITFAFYLFFITLRDFLVSKFKNLSQLISHFGFSLFILSILFNNIFTTEIITNLKVGETFQSEKVIVKFENLTQQQRQNFKSFVGKFTIKNPNGFSEIMEPELRIYNQPNITTSEADIKTNLLSDRFITMNTVQNQDYFNIRYQVKPFMIWIWLSVLLITAGGFLSLVKKNMKIKLAPLTLFVLFAVLFIILFKGLKNSNIYIPTVNLKKEIPLFAVQLFDSETKIFSDKIFNDDKYYLLNIWSSWCLPCRDEHQFLMDLKNKTNLKIIGLNYKDNTKNAKIFLNELKNPYTYILEDKDGLVAIEWGAYGVPESFLIYDNKIIKKIVGPLNSNLVFEIKEIIK